MEISKKRLFLAISLSVLITLAVSFVGFKVDQWKQQKQYAIRHNVIIFYELFSGSDQHPLGNVITHDGENYTRDAFTDGVTVTRCSYIGVGNNTAAASDTNLDTLHVGWGRQNGTIVKWINSGDSAFNCTYKFEFNATVNLNAAGLWWANGISANEMYATAGFSGGAQTFNNGENLTVRWIITYDAQNDA